MPLPPPLREAIEEEIGSIPPAELARAAAALMDFYKKADYRSAAMNLPSSRAAYLGVRLPATFAVNQRVMQELRLAWPAFAPATLLDLGAGPGTAAWAAVGEFPSLRKITFIEADPALAALGEKLARNGEPALQQAEWIRGDLRRSMPTGSFDLVVISYAVGELPTEALRGVVAAAWERTAGALVLIEPGTPAGFGRIAMAREALISFGANLAAPCPHALACPMAAANDWCHFAQRVERTAEHRRLKQGSLGYEDEKFSYVIGARQKVAAAAARVVRHPLIRPGHIQITLCAPEGIRQETIGKSQKERFRAARKAEWGDRWE